MMTPEQEILFGAYKDAVLRERDADSELKRASAALDKANDAFDRAASEFKEAQQRRGETRRAFEAALL